MASSTADPQQHGPSPILAARPPATDHMTYLTILSYTLSAENAPLLHDVLQQDAELTSAIGWDLVEMLLPIPGTAAALCLEDVARAGNPREVLLKVVEAMRNIDFADGDEDNDGETDDDESKEPRASLGTPVVGPAERFRILLTMLPTLHARLKTASPARFLAMTLEAVQRTLVSAGRHTAACVRDALALAEALARAQQPALPSRTGMLAPAPAPSQTQPQSQPQSRPAQHRLVPDPEAQNVAAPADERALQRGLLSLFVARLASVHARALDAPDAPALEWTSRWVEGARPERVVPGRRSETRAFREVPALAKRVGEEERLCGLAEKVGVTYEELWAAACAGPGADDDDDDGIDDEDEDDNEEHSRSGTSSSLSSTGALLLLAAHTSLDASYPPHSAARFRTFPEHHTLLTAFTGRASAGGAPSAGTEAPSVLDAILLLGHVALHNSGASSFTAPTSDADDVGSSSRSSSSSCRQGSTSADYETLFAHLQLLTLISANSPAPSLRAHAHALASALLHAHPSPRARLAFIANTLRHCPIAGLQASAVGWVKTELLSAAAGDAASSEPSTSVEAAAARATQPSSARGDDDDDVDVEDAAALFATPTALELLAPLLFPDLSDIALALAPAPGDAAAATTTATAKRLREAWDHVRGHMPLYLASLNLAYLLRTAPGLRERLGFGDSAATRGVRERFCEPLRRVVERGVLEGEECQEGERERVELELELLRDVLERVALTGL